MATDLGITSRGGLLQQLPANATMQQMLASLNGVFNQLNTWNGVIVKTGTVSLTTPGTDHMTTFTVPHNLGYKPAAQAFLNDVTVTVGVTVSHANLNLPTWLGISFDDMYTGGVVFSAYADMLVDDTNIYFNIYNNTGAPIGPITATYYLLRLNTDIVQLPT